MSYQYCALLHTTQKALGRLLQWDLQRKHQMRNAISLKLELELENALFDTKREK